MSTTARRPVLVTFIVVLVLLAGLASILTGILAITASGTAAAALLIVLGLAYLAVAKGLLDGRNWARITAAVVAAVEVIFAILAIVNFGGSSNEGASIGSGVVNIITLAILFSPKANAFFGSGSLSSRPV